MNNITEYKIISDPSPIKFEERVNVAIKNGWQPIGGVCYDSLSTHYIQSVVKYS